MKKAIYTITLGKNPMYDYALRTFKQYADKVGADLIICTKKRYHLNKADQLRRIKTEASLI